MKLHFLNSYNLKFILQLTIFYFLNFFFLYIKLFKYPFNAYWKIFLPQLFDILLIHYVALNTLYI